MLKTSEDLGGMLRGRLPFDGLKFADGALKLDSLSHQPWQHFPQVRDGGDSAARAEVWERQARFHDLARQLESVTGEDEYSPLFFMWLLVFGPWAAILAAHFRRP